MIVFDLKCPQEHVFEAWFADSGSFDSQVADGEVQCPMCGDHNIEKAPMAPNIAAGTGRGRGRSAVGSSGLPVKTGTAPVPALPPGVTPPTPEQMGEAIKTLRKMREVVEENFDNVGTNFPEEARKIHHGEVEKRNIYGDASKEEAAELKEEGIEVNQMPWLPRHDS
jgi:hypothetical protein